MGITTECYHTQIKNIYLVPACGWGCHKACVEVRELVVGVSFLLWLHGIWKQAWITGVWQVLYLPSHFTGPPPAVFKCGFLGWSAGLHAGMEGTSLTEPSPQPKTFLFVLFLQRLLLRSKLKVVRGSEPQRRRLAAQEDSEIFSSCLALLASPPFLSPPCFSLFWQMFPSIVSSPREPAKGHTHRLVLKHPYGNDHSTNKTFSCLRLISNLENSKMITRRGYLCHRLKSSSVCKLFLLHKAKTRNIFSHVIWLVLPRICPALHMLL